MIDLKSGIDLVLAWDRAAQCHRTIHAWQAYCVGGDGKEIPDVTAWDRTPGHEGYRRNFTPKLSKYDKDRREEWVYTRDFSIEVEPSVAKGLAA